MAYYNPSGNSYLNNYIPTVPPTNGAAYTPYAPSPTVAWIQGGEASANAYPVAPGNRVYLFDRDNKVFFIKTVDQNGIPQPLVIADYNIRQSQPNAIEASKDVTDAYVTKDEFKSYMDKIFAKLDERPHYKKPQQSKEN